MLNNNEINDTKTIHISNIALTVFSFVAASLATAIIAGALSVYITVSELQDKVANSPSKQSVASKYKFINYRLNNMNAQIVTHTHQIKDLQDVVIKLQGASPSVEHPPLRQFKQNGDTMLAKRNRY
jgi:hypothetical protein